MKSLITIVLLIIYSNTFAQLALQDSIKPSVKNISVYAIKTNAVIKIDGKLTEKDWEQTQPISNFVQVELVF